MTMESQNSARPRESGDPGAKGKILDSRLRGNERRRVSQPATHMNEPRLNLIELTVSELSASLKRTIEDCVRHVRVRGELGNVKYHSSGHVYLDLKDDKACLAGIIWRTTAQPHQAQARSRAGGGGHRPGHHLSRAARNTRSSSRRWSRPGSAR